jgi:hypothetical protein
LEERPLLLRQERWGWNQRHLLERCQHGQGYHPHEERRRHRLVQLFHRLRATNLSKLATLERKYDAQFKAVFDAIRALMATPATTKRKIGFRSE